MSTFWCKTENEPSTFRCRERLHEVVEIDREEPMADSGLDLQPNPELENRFRFHPANTEQRQRDHNMVRGACLMLAQQLDAILPPGREKSVAFTKLEEVMFWGNASVARQPGKGS